MSEPKCPARGDYIVMQNVVLTPLHMRSVWHYRHRVDDTVSPPYEAFWDSGGINVGYSYATAKSFFGDGFSNWVKHTGLHFDTSAFEHWTIRSAVLKLRVDLSNVGTDRHEDHTTSCVTRVEEAREYWWDHPNAKAMIQTVPGAENRGVQNGPDLVLDVTSIVRGWAQFPDRNFGLVLGNDKTGVDVFLDEACLTQYVPTSARLEVDFY
ncbi:MAG TPA: hypothetical protein VI319_08840, partial [Burkholderiales bacterium]